MAIDAGFSIQNRIAADQPGTQISQGPIRNIVMQPWLW
jgi:hypothetical protein